jgi:hypothetical protein
VYTLGPSDVQSRQLFLLLVYQTRVEFYERVPTLATISVIETEPSQRPTCIVPFGEGTQDDYRVDSFQARSAAWVPTLGY